MTLLNVRNSPQANMVPQIGHIPLSRLYATHIEAMFARMAQHNAEILSARDSQSASVRESVKGARLTMPASITRVRATLCKALNDAVAKYRLVDFNPALNLEMPVYDRPVVRVWTPKAIAQWKSSGFKPSPVMVWTPEQAGQFLDYTHEHDRQLYALFLLVILAGPRRGEAVGLRTDQVDLDDQTITFSHQTATRQTPHEPIPARPQVADPVTWTGAGLTHLRRDASSMAELRTFNQLIQILACVAFK